METSKKRTIAAIAKGASYIAWFWAIANLVILAIGFVLLLFGANPTAGFTQWAYRNLDRVMEPFRGIFTPIEVGQTGTGVESVVETSILFAMIVYLILLMVIRALTGWLTYRVALLDHQLEQEQFETAAAARPDYPA